MTTTLPQLDIRPNISWLTNTVATGGDLAYDPNIALAQADALVAMGVTHVFDGRIEDDDSEIWAERGVIYVRYGVNDPGGDAHLPYEYFDHAVELARDAAASGGKILAHCHMGINRGPSAAAAILIDRGWQPERALQRIVRARPIAGVYYFMDAVEADAERRGERLSPSVSIRLRRRWAQLVRTPERIKHVQRAIMAGRRHDMAQRKAVWDSLK